jgi:hypothetical protein
MGTTYEMMHPREVQITPRATGAAANLVISATDRDLLSGTRTGTGIFNLVFRKKYPIGLVPSLGSIIGTTTGLVAIFTAWDATAGTATVKFSVGSVATDPAVGDILPFMFVVRNSNKN